MSRPRAPSDFDLSLMPQDRIVKRTLHSYSVHHSVSSPGAAWVATISRPEQVTTVNDPLASGTGTKLRYSQFTFNTERQARKFCQAFAPPKQVPGTVCRICNDRSTQRHCRNCGVPLCDRCSIRWGARMVPKTYLVSTTTTVRVCKSCDWLSNAFCLSLLQGRYEDALTIHGTGNVNVRTSFADIHREAMFPVHCAVMGGSVELVRWLVEKQLCPITTSRDPKTNRVLSVRTSENRTLLDLAMTGRPKVDILMYLIQQGLSMEDVKDTALASKTLEAVMKSGAMNPKDAEEIQAKGSDDIDSVLREVNVIQQEESVVSLEDPCKLCCDKAMDCVLVPCGHQMCCSDCAAQLSKCPVCKVDCSVLRIYRQ